MTLLLDTNVVSELRKRPTRRPEAFNAWAAQASLEDTVISVVTVMEIRRGVELKRRNDPAQGEVLAEWFHRLLDAYRGRIYLIDTAVAQQAGLLQVPDPRPIADTLIAATAIVHDFTVATRNTADFTGTGVPLVNPWTPAPSSGLSVSPTELLRRMRDAGS
ncbi:MAG: type II toxin-antitoxin system VapC family toxin [Bifidobacteriaceae bacterium]|nr:type II toxin-antitoxin system VapC family toxin [Bifidobacteriaceae bacterium]